MVRQPLQRGTIEVNLPLLEHTEDTERNAMSRVITTFDGDALPSRFVLSFMGDALERYAQNAHLEPVASIHSETCDFPVYATTVDGCDVGLLQLPVGAPAACMLFDLLIASGVKAAVACGGCGVLEPIDSGRILVPTFALRDEGTSYHYVAPERWIALEGAAVDAVHEALASHQVPYEDVRVWTTDGFFRETPQMIARRLAEGCAAVDMECASLAAVAQFYGVSFAEILYSGDKLEQDGSHDERAWLLDYRTRDIAFLMALAACANTAL